MKKHRILLAALLIHQTPTHRHQRQTGTARPVAISPPTNRSPHLLPQPPRLPLRRPTIPRRHRQNRQHRRLHPIRRQSLQRNRKHTGQNPKVGRMGKRHTKTESPKRRHTNTRPAKQNRPPNHRRLQRLCRVRHLRKEHTRQRPIRSIRQTPPPD